MTSREVGGREEGREHFSRLKKLCLLRPYRTALLITAVELDLVPSGDGASDGLFFLFIDVPAFLTSTTGRTSKQQPLTCI